MDDVELLNINTANALLKFIENPSTFDFFILINNKKSNSGTITFAYQDLDQLEKITDTIKNNY